MITPLHPINNNPSNSILNSLILIQYSSNLPAHGTLPYPLNPFTLHFTKINTNNSPHNPILFTHTKLKTLTLILLPTPNSLSGHISK